jgi:phage terminase large subunit GpA-like protein
MVARMIDLKLRKALGEAAKLFKPPPATTLIEWADRFRVVASGTSATPGKWRTSAQPCAFGPMAAVVEGDTHTITVMASTQSVKTELLINTACYFVHADPSAILLVQPTQGAAEAFAKERLGPTIDATPCLKELVPTPRSRIGDATITHRSYPGGAIDLVGANAPTDLASRPKRIVLLDETDKYPASAGSEGDPMHLAEERASTYKNIGRAKFVRTCSPTDTESRIAREYNFSDQRRLYVACPHCGHEQTLKWKHVKWDKGTAGDHLVETAGIECESCSVRWSERERREVMERLEFAPAYGWRQTANFTCCNETQPAQQWDSEGRSTCMHCGSKSPYEGHAGFHVSKLYSIRHRLSDVVREFLEAKHSGDHELLRKFFNTALAEIFEPQLGEGIDGSALITRLENYTPDTVPLGVEVVTGFCDVQGDRLEIQFVGWAFNEEAFALDYVIINLDPGQGAAWRELDTLTLRTFRRCDGKALPCAAFGIDAGGMHGSQVFDFARKRRGRRIFPCYGRAGKIAIWTSQAGRNKQNDPFWKIGVDSAKDAIYSRLKILPDIENKPVAGCIHFPALPIFNAEYFAGLTAERREKRMRFGQPYTVYVCPAGKRNEPLDTMVGCLAVRRSVPAGQRSSLEFSVYAPKETTMTPRGLRPATAPPVHHGKKITGRSLDPAPRRLMP